MSSDSIPTTSTTVPLQVYKLINDSQIESESKSYNIPIEETSTKSIKEYINKYSKMLDDKESDLQWIKPNKTTIETDEWIVPLQKRPDIVSFDWVIPLRKWRSNLLPSLYGLQTIANWKKLYIEIYAPKSNYFTNSVLKNEDIFNLFQKYSIREPIETYWFLKENENLLNFINETCYQLKNYFPANEITLDLKSNWYKGGDKLAIYIQTNYSPDKTFERLKKFDKEWWLKQPKEKREKIFVNVEFK